ncbi:hypothetical protein L6452_21694 [Arctium lappa]|uniref:Uncharacterized protein n=1 Tax=Arctium lappa TaxID=4217 RepID=A0ACB9AYM9_ARCLA|nr:hypothetical protein L6452_21694 [Arctium lappa]
MVNSLHGELQMIVVDGVESPATTKLIMSVTELRLSSYELGGESKVIGTSSISRRPVLEFQKRLTPPYKLQPS